VPGTYALLIELKRPRYIVIGRRGRRYFPAGFYVYAGSALGPGGLAARLARHLRQAKAWHWHIDYLLSAQEAHVTRIWIHTGRRRLECKWASRFVQLPGAALPVPRFGASDCRCLSHLIWFAQRPDAVTGCAWLV